MGAFSTVVLAAHNDGVTKAALKLYQRVCRESVVKFDTAAFNKEIEILRQIALNPAARDFAPSIVAYDPTLQWMLLTPVGRQLDFDSLTRDVVGQLVDALHALHEVCIHRDLRHANILLVHGKVRIIDWNLALSREEALLGHKPLGAVYVQGFDVLYHTRRKSIHYYSARDDLQSLVRTLFLLASFTHIPVCIYANLNDHVFRHVEVVGCNIGYLSGVDSRRMDVVLGAASWTPGSSHRRLACVPGLGFGRAGRAAHRLWGAQDDFAGHAARFES